MPHRTQRIGMVALCLVVGIIPFLKPVPGQTDTQRASVRAGLNRSSAFPNLTGEKAIEHLKQDGSYDSLAEAMAAARYSANWVSNPRLPHLNGAYEADNPAQGFTSYFTSEGVHLVAAGEGTPQWFLEMKLQGIGYGDKLGNVSVSTPKVMNNRVELTRNSALSPEPSALIEWYENSPAGLEQGLTLDAPPGERNGTDWLRVAFEVDGTLEARRSADGQVIHFYNRAGDQVLSYSKLVVTDAQGQLLPAQMEMASSQVVLEIDDTGAEYPVTIDPTFGQQSKLTASDGAAGDQFGAAVAINGETVVVGAPLNDIGANSDQGSAYVFVRNGTTWSQQAQLLALAPAAGAAGDRFGASVAISGETIVVAAPRDAIGANLNQGSAYVYVRSGTTWTQQTQLLALAPAAGATGDTFGNSVAISGETVVVGAGGVNISGNPNQGAAYVYVRNGTTWTQQTQLLALAPAAGAAGDTFGFSVGISGETIVVGANGTNTGGNSDQGSAYVYVRSGTTWSQQANLTAADGMMGDNFGWSVAISGETVVAGSPGDDIGANNGQGSAYVFVRSGTTWSQQQKLTASDGATNDVLGEIVAISGETVVVGADSDDIGTNLDQGSAYVFVRSGTTWSQQQQLTASEGLASDQFGVAVAVSGETAVVGAPLDDIGAATDQGSAYVFACPATTRTWNQQAKNTASDGAANDQFGVSVAINGETAVVGALQDDIGANSNQGSAYVFVRSGTTWSQQQKLTASDGAADDQFGIWVAISGETVVVGASLDDIGANPDQGSAYVYVRSGTTWSQQQKLTASDGVASDIFGWSVAIIGETVVVGARGDDIGANSDQGSAYVFVRSGTSWSQQQRLTASDGAAFDQLGVSVAISGETVVVGADGDDIGAAIDQGSAYVFVRSGTTWSQQQKLTASDGAGNDGFGQSVAISGETVVVGVYQDDISANIDQGSAYVFVRTGTTWSQQQKLTASDGAMSDQFGVSVAINGETVVVGAYVDDVSANSNQGSAYVFVRSGTTWSQRQRLTASDGAFDDRFGISVAISGETAVVGSYFDDISAATDQGSAYVFVLDCVCPTITGMVTGGGTICAGSSATVTVTIPGGGTSPYTVTLNNGGGTQMGPSPLTFTVSPGTTTTYAVQSGIDATGCPVTGSGSATVTVTSAPTSANAGLDQTICTAGGTLSANTPSIGTGTWSVVSGPNTSSTQFGNVTTPGTTFAPTMIGVYTLQWAIANPPCTTSTDTVVITVNAGPTPANAGPDQTLCTTGGTLAANLPIVGTGTWSVVSGPNLSSTQFGNINTPGTTFAPTGVGTYTLQWAIASAPCTTSTDTVVITVNGGPTLANAGPDQTLCLSTPATLAANVPGVGTGNWSVVSGPNLNSSQFSSLTTANATFTPAGGAGSYTLQWMTTNSPCLASTDTVVITFNPVAAVNAGPDQGVCENAPTVTLAGSFGGSATTATWSGGAGTFSPNNTTPNATYTPTAGEIAAGVVTLTYSTDDPTGPCPAGSDSMTVTISSCIGVMVADTTNNRIQAFDGVNWTVIGVGTVGTGNGQFRLPEAVTFDEAGRIYVADTGNNRIQWSTDSGATWADFATNGIATNQVKAPQGLALDANGNLYVSDTGNGRVMRFNGGIPGSGVVIATNGTASGQVGSPRGLVIDATFRLFVTDETNSRILRINNAHTTVSGTSGSIIASTGVGMNQVRNPQGITIDGSGTLFVADTGNSRILRWVNANPNTATTMALTGSGLGQVNRPEGVTVTQFATGPFSGGLFLVVGDTLNNRIQGRFIPTGQWNLVGAPNGIGAGVGQFRAPSKIR